MILGTLRSLYAQPTQVKAENPSGQTLPLGNTKSSSVITHLETSENLASLTQGYDVRSMTPRQMADLSLQMYQNGMITFEDHALLSFQPDLGLNDLGMNKPDEKKDYMAHWQELKDFHDQRGESQFAQKDQRILNVLGNIEALAQQQYAQDGEWQQAQ
ncbi:MAG: hypothetical protein HWE18_03855 [Gammaproteobacteria bacterium]|nr:hypothetical protein [Gammaproteobacteria bacterium]